MGFFRHRGRESVIFPRSVDKTYKALLVCLERVGKVKDKNDTLKRIVFKAGLKYNFANVSIQLLKKDMMHTEVTLSSNVADGIIGLNSANRIIERIIKELTAEFEK